jgi:two-component system response regulator HydG
MKSFINVAATEHCSVLLLGETGTGKTVYARWIHDNSPRKNCAFVDINCSGLKGSLLKSELFGHARGAFTGAIDNRIGLIKEADGGTLFLDEIGDMDIWMQCLLLKAVEEKTYRCIGENKLRSSDFRLICATSRNLLEAIENGTFREDLFYRINTLTISIPSLRARRDDIPGLLNHILKSMGYDNLPLDNDVMKALARCQWRGNVRELRSALEKALVFARGEELTLEHFANIFEEMLPERAGLVSGQKITWNLNDLEEAHILRALNHFGSNKAKTSAALGISLSSLYRKLDKMWKEDAVKAAAP